MKKKIRPYPKVCAFCEENFLGDKKNSKYCSSTCRYAWQARNQSEKTKLRRQEYQKKWGTLNWQRKREYMLEYTYGITNAQYEKLLAEQDFRCAVCKRPETDFGRKLAVDHDHKTSEIFGLLCQVCNHTLIGRYRDPAIFLAASKYLEEGTGWFVPKRKNKKFRKRKKRRAKKLRVPKR